MNCFWLIGIFLLMSKMKAISASGEDDASSSGNETSVTTADAVLPLIEGFKAISAEVEALKAKVGSQSSKISSLQSKDTSLESTTSSLRSRISTLENRAPFRCESGTQIFSPGVWTHTASFSRSFSSTPKMTYGTVRSETETGYNPIAFVFTHTVHTNRIDFVRDSLVKSPYPQGYNKVSWMACGK